MRQAVIDSPVGALRLPEDPEVGLVFSDRANGNVSLSVGGGDVAAARARLVGTVGLAPRDAVFMEQVHGAGVATVGRADRGRGAIRSESAVTAVDALVTRDTDVALVVLVADCVPLLLADPGRAVAAVHAGRRGIVGGVVRAAVEALGDDPRRVVAVLGPAIGACCYEVPADLADAVTASVPAAAGQTRWGSPALDLPAAVTAQLTAAGVGCVRRSGSCTRCASDRWFSHRGDAPALRGRQAGVVCRRATPDSRSGLTGPGDRVA